MAISAANAASPTPATGNPVATGAGTTAGNGGANGSAFIDSLQAVLGVSGIANGPQGAANDPQFAALVQNKLAALKNKLKMATAESGALAVNPQIAQPQQAAIISKLENTGTGIDIPALRAAMAKGAAAPASPAVPTAPAGAANASPAVPANAMPQPGQQSVQQPIPNAPATDKDSSTPANAPGQTAGADPSKAAIDGTTQQKLVTALVEAANAPVLKEGTADGSKVPNAKIGHHIAHKQAPQPAGNQVAAAATKIAATAGITNTPDTASTAAQGVAVAEVAIKTAPAAPSVTKVETAAITNATQTATHAPAQQASVEAQAIPVQFDAQSAKSGGKDSNAGGDTSGKDQSQSGDPRTANDSAKAGPNQSPAPAPIAAQPAAPAPAAPAPTQTAHAASSDVNANTALAGAANTPTAVAAPQIAVNLHVAPQPQQNALPDQTAFAALGVTIAAKSQDGERHFDIRLDPAELGKVDVRISVDSDGKAQAHLAAEHPQTLQILQNDKGNLERQLRDAGLNLANNGLNFSLRGEQQSSTPTFNARNRALSISAVQTPDTTPTTSLASLAPGDSRLDIRV